MAVMVRSVALWKGLLRLGGCGKDGSVRRGRACPVVAVSVRKGMLRSDELW